MSEKETQTIDLDDIKLKWKKLNHTEKDDFFKTWSVELAFDDLDIDQQKDALTLGWGWGVAEGNNPNVEQAQKINGYLFRPKQRLFWFAPVFYPCYIGAFGSGKSLIGLLRALWLSYAYPGTRGIIVRETYPQLMDTDIATLNKIFAHFNLKQGVHYEHYTSKKLFVLDVNAPNGQKSEILYRPAKSEGQSLQSAVQDFRSLEVDWIFVDEAPAIDERIFLTLMGRRGRWGKVTRENCVYGEEWYQDYHRSFMVVGNPPNEDHYIYKRWVEKQFSNNKALDEDDAKQHYLVMASTYDNRRNLPDDYIKALESYPDSWKQTYLLGKWGFVPPEGEPVYNFQEDVYATKKHIDADERHTILRGWDLSPTGKHKACVICQIDSRGILVCLDEVTDSEPSLEAFAKKVIAFCNIKYPNNKTFKDYGDPASFHVSQTDMQSPAGILSKTGINLVPGDQSPGIRIHCVQQLLNSMKDGVPGLQINKTCKKLMQGFNGGYHYKIISEGQGKFSQQPNKNQWSHIHDALQYLCTRLSFVDKTSKKEMLDQIRKRVDYLYT